MALWIASIWWTFRDIRSRSTDLFLQVAATLLVTIFSFAGLLIYIILRPTKTLSQLYEESLEEDILAAHALLDDTVAAAVEGGQASLLRWSRPATSPQRNNSAAVSSRGVYVCGPSQTRVHRTGDW